MRSPMNKTILMLPLLFLTASTYTQTDPGPFKNRRDSVLLKLGGNALILYGGGDDEKNRSESKVDNYFWYLTGCDDPDVFAVLDPGAQKKYMLFVPEANVIAEIYNGKQPGKEEIRKLYGADTVISWLMMPRYIRAMAVSKRPIFTAGDVELIDNFNRNKKEEDQLQVLDARPFLDEMRLFKDAYEIDQLQKACDITGQALVDAWKQCQPGMYEYELEALIEYGFRRQGSPMPAYRSIVGSGANATTLHYDRNTRKMENGDLVLMDVGAEYGYYASDVTRTIPVNGKFSQAQRDIYELVLKAETEGLKEIKPGIGDLVCHHRTVEVISEGLLKLGLMTDANSLWQKKVYNIYRVTHWLGLDVHDVGSYGPASPDFRTYMFNPEVKGRSFEPGMVTTIEPGLYLRPDLLENLRLYAGQEVPQAELDEFVLKVKPVFEKYKNIGVRIEDDVLVTPDGHRVLTSSAPKTIAEIEKIMQKSMKP